MAKNNSFEQVIQTYLAKRAAEDELFAVKYKDESKSVAKCCAYIKEQARQKAQNGCAIIEDAQVFGWAVHYYDESMPTDGKADAAVVGANQGDCVVAQTEQISDKASATTAVVELTEEQKQAIQQKAEADYYAECKAKEQEKAKAKAKADAERKKAQAAAKRESEAKTMQMLFNFD
jgi:hypothetical protein